jgi:hypothetical protein
MGLNVAAYRSLFVTDEARRIDSETNIRFMVPEMRKHFKDAAKGKDVVSQDLLNGLTGRNPDLYRSYPNAPVNYSPADVNPLIETLRWQKSLDVLTEQQQNELDQNFKNLAEKTGLDESLLRKELNKARDYEGSLNSHLYVILGRNQDAYSDIEKISELVKKRAREGTLTAEDKAQLDRNLDLYSRKYNIPASELSAHIRTFEDDVKTSDSKLLLSVIQGVEEIRVDRGTAAESVLMVPDYARGYNALLYAAGLDIEDSPNKKPPGTADQWEFLTALHEAEHHTGLQNEKMPANLIGSGATHAREIDADRAVMKALDDMNEPAMKKYWLQRGQIYSFKHGPEENFHHDTSTFLRVEEETRRTTGVAQQIDITAFREQKAALVQRVHARLQDPEKASYKDYMGAVKDLLREDAAEADPKKKLTPVQRAEAESFLEDAAAIGYKANPNYPKAPPKAEPPAFVPSAMVPAA